MSEIEKLEAEIVQLQAQFNYEIGKRKGQIELLQKQEEDKQKPKDETKEDKSNKAV